MNRIEKSKLQEIMAQFEFQPADRHVINRGSGVISNANELNALTRCGLHLAGFVHDILPHRGGYFSSCRTRVLINPGIEEFQELCTNTFPSVVASGFAPVLFDTAGNMFFIGVDDPKLENVLLVAVDDPLLLDISNPDDINLSKVARKYNGSFYDFLQFCLRNPSSNVFLKSSPFKGRRRK